MRKPIIIEDKNNPRKRRRLIENKFIEWILYIIIYALVLIGVSVIFKSLYINLEYYGLYALLAAIIIYLLNQTIKPVLFYLTLPLTALSMGLFYPIINVFILYLTGFILGDNFNIRGLIIPFFIAILISILNLILEGLIIKPIVKRKG